ncbi:MAG: HD domain-containing protein [Salibacteraceae bacterium]
MRLSSRSKVEEVSIHPKTKSIKTFNDPIYGFITVDEPLIFNIIEHPHFQRLRRITQLGLTNLVYGGANHNRFQHAIGAMNLMRSAIQTLRTKGIVISEEEEVAAKAAILLHDIGHGPYSHALENTIVQGVNHESIGLKIMQNLNNEMNGQLDLAIKIYTDKYPVRFLHQLVSSQLDTDRLDYLKRDSFFTGVSEGVIGSERIIKMLTVHDGSLAVEAKGIYSLEKFLVARRLMYWQVYLHKTVVSAEFLLMHILLRAKELAAKGIQLDASDSLRFFLYRNGLFSSAETTDWLKHFVKLDDFDILYSIKQWIDSDDAMLGEMCKRLINRKLLKVKVLDRSLSDDEMQKLLRKGAKITGHSLEEMHYLIFQKTLSNTAYKLDHDRITILHKDGHANDISDAASLFNFSGMDAKETKHFLYMPPEVPFH